MKSLLPRDNYLSDGGDKETQVYPLVTSIPFSIMSRWRLEQGDGVNATSRQECLPLNHWAFLANRSTIQIQFFGIESSWSFRCGSSVCFAFDFNTRQFILVKPSMACFQANDHRWHAQVMVCPAFPDHAYASFFLSPPRFARLVSSQRCVFAQYSYHYRLQPHPRNWTAFCLFLTQKSHTHASMFGD